MQEVEELPLTMWPRICVFILMNIWKRWYSNILEWNFAMSICFVVFALCIPKVIIIVLR